MEKILGDLVNLRRYKQVTTTVQSENKPFQLPVDFNRSYYESERKKLWAEAEAILETK